MTEGHCGDKKERGSQGGKLSPLHRGRRFSFLGVFSFLYFFDSFLLAPQAVCFCLRRKLSVFSSSVSLCSFLCFLSFGGL